MCVWLRIVLLSICEPPLSNSTVVRSKAGTGVHDDVTPLGALSRGFPRHSLLIGYHAVDLVRYLTNEVVQHACSLPWLNHRKHMAWLGRAEKQC